MGLFSKLFGSKKEEMPAPVEVCQVVVDEQEAKEQEAKKQKKDSGGDVTVDFWSDDHKRNHEHDHPSWFDNDAGDGGSDGGGD